MRGDISLEQWLDCQREAQDTVARYRSEAPKDFDPQATFVAVAIGGAALVGAGATAYSASSAANSASAAQSSNAKIAAQNQALQLQLFNLSRGSQGSALLPQYPSYQAGNVEQNLANQAYATYLSEQAALGTPSDQIKSYQDIVAGYAPAQAASDQLVNNLFSGQLQNQEIQNIAPVEAARGEVAQAQKQGILEGLSARLNALSADRARAGYVGGGSTFQKNLLTGATIPALQAAGTVGAQADLANAADVAGIKQQNINTQLSNLNLPLTQAGNKIQMSALPATAAGATYTNSLQPFSFFKLGVGSPGFTPAPYVTPIPNAGSISGAGVAQGASTLGNYFANSAIASQLNANSQSPYAYSYYNNVNQPITQNDAQMMQTYGLGG